MQPVDLGGVLVGPGQPCYVVAELGINHNGCMETARRMIDVAAEAGAQCVKFQKRTPGIVYSQEELDRPFESPWGSTRRDYVYQRELGVEQLGELFAYAHENHVHATASAWDERSLRVVAELCPPWLKIASAHVTHYELLRAHTLFGVPLVMSTGMSTLDEVAHAVELVEPVALLSCTSAYPCAHEDIHLRWIETLRTRFGLPVGYSGHERGIAASVAAVALGACIVERHLTLDRTSFGTDQAASLEPPGFKRMVRDIRAVEAAMGDAEKRVLPSEVPIRAKLRRTV